MTGAESCCEIIRHNRRFWFSTARNLLNLLVLVKVNPHVLAIYRNPLILLLIQKMCLIGIILLLIKQLEALLRIR
ncbi:hypothetical protein D3C81_1581790 [compost metagenome]